MRKLIFTLLIVLSFFFVTSVSAGYHGSPVPFEEISATLTVAEKSGLISTEKAKAAKIALTEIKSGDLSKSKDFLASITGTPAAKTVINGIYLTHEAKKLLHKYEHVT